MSCSSSYLIAALLVLLLVLVVFNPLQEGFQVKQLDWANTARGLNASNKNGYEPSVYMLREMEIAKSGNILVDLEGKKRVNTLAPKGIPNEERWLREELYSQPDSDPADDRYLHTE